MWNSKLPSIGMLHLYFELLFPYSMRSPHCGVSAHRGYRVSNLNYTTNKQGCLCHKPVILLCLLSDLNNIAHSGMDGV